MRSLPLRLVGLTLALAGVVACGRSFARAADPPYAGSWKVVFAPPGQSISLLLLKIEDKNGKPEATILSAGVPRFKDAKVQKLKTDGTSLRLTVQAGGDSFEFLVYFPKEQAKPEKLLGSVSLGGQPEFARLERSDLKELDSDPRKIMVASPAVGDLRKAMQTEDAKEKEKALKEIVAKNSGDSIVFLAAFHLLGFLLKNDAKEEDVRAQADQLIDAAGVYGPEMKFRATQVVTQTLLGEKKHPALALAYAQQLEKELAKDTPLAGQAAALKLLRAALRNSGKTDEAKEIAPRLHKVDIALDEEFAKKAVPFEPEAPARKGKNDRVVLVELFTGAQCPPCVSADVAFDALLKSTKPADIVLLQYHVHIPGPDPLTNKDSEARSSFYQIPGTPTLLIDGKDVPAMGGSRQDGKDRYQTILKSLAEPLDAPTQAKLDLSATRTDAKINIRATIADLKKPGDRVFLRFVLVEDLVRWPGSNGQRLHHHVVRGFPGGVKGMALKEATAKQDVMVDLAEMKKGLNDYLAKEKFDEDSRPLDLKNLKVVAFIQNDDSKEVLQTAQVDLSQSKPETE
jgi:hypothetical protein